MSSAFDKSPERGPDPGPQGGDGTEHTAPLGPPPPGYGATPAYGQPGPPGAPAYGYPPAYGYAAPEHPKASTSLVLGILGVVLCQVVAPFAWVIGKRTVGEIDASGGRWGGRGQAQAGYVLGIVGSVLLGLYLTFALLYVVFVGVALVGVAGSAG